MGRHSSGTRGPYMRSVLGWALPWILIAAIAIAAVWFIVNAVGGRQIALEDGNPSRTSSPSDRAQPSPTETPTPKPSRSKPSPSPKRSPKGDRDDLITEGVTVQVVNGTGGIEGAAAAMADRLASLGYRVEAMVTGLTVDRTAVNWSTESDREAAVALAAHFGWASGPASPNLTRDVDIHVIVAPDEARG
ncbi:MAG TPA: LytR C-terminal domain-containing protein [Actinomycetota bacterium]|nr:LytR C-terminal domain-containing protein [Actinomycetota bacterium]